VLGICGSLLKQRQLEILKMTLPDGSIFRKGSGDVGIDHASNHFFGQSVRQPDLEPGCRVGPDTGKEKRYAAEGIIQHL